MSRERPLVSVVIPAFNSGAYLRESIASVRQQTVDDVEIIVVDDASADELSGLFDRDPFFAGVRLLRHASNRGPGESRRTGVRAAGGTYIAFLDADDIMEPGLLEAALDVMRTHPTVGLCCCDGVLIGVNGMVLDDGRTFNGINAAIKGYALRTGVRPLEQIFLFSTIGIGFVVRRQVFDRVDYPAGRRLEDYEFQLDVAANGFDVYYLHEPLARYRMHPDNSSGAASGTGMSEQLVASLERARDTYAPIRRLGRIASRRIADARMDLACLYLKAGRFSRGLRTLLQAFAEYPPQIVAFAQFASRSFVRRVFA